MSVRRSLIIPIAVLIGLSAAACGSDTKTASSTTTAAEKKDASTTTAAGGESSDTTGDETTTTLSAKDFDAAMASARDEVAAAGDDFCKVALAANNLGADSPSTAEQAKALYEVYASIFTKIADGLPAESAAEAATLKSATEKMLSDAEAEDYDPATLQGGKPPAAFSDTTVTQAMSKVGEYISSTCTDPAAG